MLGLLFHFPGQLCSNGMSFVRIRCGYFIDFALPFRTKFMQKTWWNFWKKTKLEAFTSKIPKKYGWKYEETKNIWRREKNLRTKTKMFENTKKMTENSKICSRTQWNSIRKKNTNFDWKNEKMQKSVKL